MERISIEASKREIGKTRALRSKGQVPAVLYGKGFDPLSISVNEKAVEKAVATHAGMNVLLDLDVGGKEKLVARIRQFQADPISRRFVHIDFQTVDMKQKIMVEVPVYVEGKSKGVSEGGVLVIDRRTLGLKCLPTAIPEKITVDITLLDIGDSIHINNLKLPEGVECPHEVNFSIVSVVAPMKEEVAAPTAEAVLAEGAAAPTAGAPGVAAPAAAGAAPAGGTAAGASKAAPAGSAATKTTPAAKEKK